MTRLVCFAILLLLAGSSGLGIAAESPTYEIEDRGQRRIFEVATNEVHLKQADGKRSIQALADVNSPAQAKAKAESLAKSADAEAELVLYEKGVARNEFNRRILTRKVLLQLAPDADLQTIQQQLGLASPLEKVTYAENAYLAYATTIDGALTLSKQAQALGGVVSAEPLLAKQAQKKLVPNDTLYSNQWHLNNFGQNGGASNIDINVDTVWNTYRGAGITIAVVDDGVQRTHPDLSANFNLALSRDFNDNDADPSPIATASDYHGTACAGLVAGRGNNGVGITGVAYEATLVGLRLISVPETDFEEGAALSHSNTVIAVKSNSWGVPDDGASLEGPGPLLRAALQSGVEQGRGGRGTIFVWAGGNGLANDDNVNYDGYANSIYTIAVAAVSDQGFQSDYSEPGACLVVAAPSDSAGRQGLVTTDLTGSNGYNFTGASGELSDRNYTQTFGGTSGATPIVSGVVALMLQANPNLGWRDVKEILLRTATQVDAGDNDWANNGAGMRFNHKYGAGLVNAQAAVTRALTWTNLPPMRQEFIEEKDLNIAIPDDNETGIKRNFSVPTMAYRVEQVTVTVDITHPFRGDVEVSLTSPSGMVSKLSEQHSDAGDDYRNWTFSTVRHWGENISGTWTVQVRDLGLEDLGTLTSVRLDFYGTTPGSDVLINEITLNDSLEGNANGYADPGETIHSHAVLTNTTTSPITGATTRFVPLSPFIVPLTTDSTYGSIAPGQPNSPPTPFRYRIAKNTPCGSVLEFATHVTVKGITTTNRFTLQIGKPELGARQTNEISSGNLNLFIDDHTTVNDSANVNLAGNQIIEDINVGVRINHQFDGDLIITLEHPDETPVKLALNVGSDGMNFGSGSCGANYAIFDDQAFVSIENGSAPFTGSYYPSWPLASLNGKPANGEWRFSVADVGTEDTGTLLCWKMVIVSRPLQYVCTVFNRAPAASNLTYQTTAGTGVSLALSGTDADADAISYQIVSQPAHGQLTGFNSATGQAIYTPTAGFTGADTFTYRVNDGTANSVNATVSLQVNGATPISLGNIERVSNSTVRFSLSGTAGKSYVIQTSTNLTQWTSLSTNAFNGTPLTITDNNATEARRFYRAVEQ